MYKLNQKMAEEWAPVVGMPIWRDMTDAEWREAAKEYEETTGFDRRTLISAGWFEHVADAAAEKEG